jgi:outer membrane immunogenic protein
MTVIRLAEHRRTRAVSALAALAALLAGPLACADSGLYVGGSVGSAGVEVDQFNENDTAWKAFGGYIFDMPVVDFAVEAGYVDFGAPSATILGENFDLDVTGFSAFGLAGLDFGLVGAFVKAGFVSWDAKLNVAGMSDSDSGTDPAYGVGLRFNFSSLEIRGEYERFDVQDADTVDMVSLGVLWRF